MATGKLNHNSDSRLTLEYMRNINFYANQSSCTITFRINDSSIFQIYFDGNSLKFRHSTDGMQTWTVLKTFS